ncbi:MAG: glycoside hydrolase family 127 protein [Treponema sp.]|jgi:DUF1680 family protein|nr:glycoside hydrolase family 127 protein [Treponema sp.]
MDRLNRQVINNNEKNKIPDRIFSPLRGVRLTDGLFARVFQNNIQYLQKVNIDSALYWFRKRAGKAAPGKPYRGHFEDNIKGQTAGLVLMGAGNALRWVKDANLEKMVNTIVDEIKACSGDDGYLMAVPREQFGTLEYPHYVRIWLTYGLYAAALGGRADALDMLRRWQDWFNRCDDLPVIKYLSLAFQGVVCSPFVYNTPIGKPEDIETTVKYYEEDWRLGQFIMREPHAVETRRQPGVEPHPHGTELESFEGYLDLYRATGKHYYLRSVMNAYEMYKRDWQHVGGGIVMCEFLNAYPGCNWLSPPKPYNELCCTSFWILLNQRLHRLFPDKEEYVGEIEKSLYNIAVANQDGNEGIRYFAWIDKHKQKGGLVHCCCGVGTRLFGLLPEFLYSVNDDALYVDIYNASQFDWERKDGNVTVRTVTQMPYDSKVTIELKGKGRRPFILYLRIPAWTEGGVTVIVDGGEDRYSGVPGTYLAIERDWSGDHTVEFALPFKWVKTLYRGAEEYCDDRAEPPIAYRRWAFEYGPLLMAVTGAGQGGESAPGMEHGLIILNKDPEAFPGWLKPGGKPLHFAIEDYQYRMIPYFEIGNDETFSCYPHFYMEALSCSK